MLLQKTLKYGDTIGIYSPSLPATYTSPKRFERAKSYLQQKGFHILEGSLTGRYDYCSTKRKPYEILLEVL